jgi:UDP-N-acetylglucosamine--N-acetylmuramyl-(pentapeptide) pyrophosphoryl-undecaprenol N-acetylglucosamine transferase
LLVLGGSQGARALNEIVLRALARVKPWPENWRVVHQTGTQDSERVSAAYRQFGIPATVLPFFSDIGSVYSQATLVISRAGGTTLSELAVHSLPSVLIPYPGSVRNHQTLNALEFERAGAAVHIPQDSNLEIPMHRLCEILLSLMGDSTASLLKRQPTFPFPRFNASQAVAELILNYCSSPHPTRPADSLTDELIALSPPQ